MEVDMMPAPKADVVVVWEERFGSIEEFILDVLEYGGPTLGRLLLVVESVLGADTANTLESIAARDCRLQIIEGAGERGFAARCNQALTLRQGDVVLLRADCAITGTCLLDLAAVAHEDERTACVSPLIAGGGTCSVPELFGETCCDGLNEATVREACKALPRWTLAPLLSASCIYLRGNVVDAVGLLDPSFFSPSAAVNNWVLRAQSLGFSAKRCNHVYVHRLSACRDLPGEDFEFDFCASVAEVEHGDHLRHQIENFRKTLDGQMAAHAVRVESTRKLRVAIDIRHLPDEQVGTRTYAVCLAKSLAAIPELELTLLVRHAKQAAGLSGRIVTAEDWQDDVEVIHKPAQVTQTSELHLLFSSSAHLVVTYQDLIGYRIPKVFPDDVSFDRYRSTSSLVLPAAQRLVSYSQNTADEIAAEFGIPVEEIAVVPLGVDAECFSRREPRDWSTSWKLGLPRRYFFCLATDFPHKNIAALLEAYAILRKGWKRGRPPWLLLAGHATGGRSRYYSELSTSGLPVGVKFLGPVSPEQLRVLYQRALALVFPSLYEGFGLPPVEAMAAGTPVIAMPISAVREVGGDCVMYPDALSAASLARSMELLAVDANLRDRLRTAGANRAAQLLWQTTGTAMRAVYRSTVLDPSDRALQMRRLLTAAIMRWAADSPARHMPDLAASLASSNREVAGIRNACTALNVSIAARARREIKRLRGAVGLETAAGRPAKVVRERSLSA
jgi:glycosyltransferase involved in cell wall biosynthesis